VQRYLLPLLMAVVLLCSLWPGSASAFDTTAEETMLMFVGEVEPTITVASRQPESPSTAPAMATVIGRGSIKKHAYRTLGELLAAQPGFYIVGSGRGTVPYFRGIRNGILFMYDGVPITTDVTKSFAPLDMEYSLEPIQQVEITTGPGSVLWGTDAFAAVVNIVPASGRRDPGIVLGAGGGTQRQARAHASFAHADDKSDIYLYAGGSQARFHNEDYISTLDATAEVDTSEYREFVGTYNYADWFHLSGRWSDFERNFTMHDAVNDLMWDGAKQTPFNYVKLSLSGSRGPEHYSLSGYLQQTDFRLRDADIEREQENTTTYLEFLWDRRIFKRGLITAGVSWRNNDVSGALIRDSFQPDFLKPSEQLFAPSLDQEDFSSDQYAAFTQVRYRIDNSEIWLGGRYEDHSEYSSSISYSMGFQTPLSETLRLKTTYGTAYRSPYSKQLFNADSLDQEEISTLSTQLVWEPARGQRYALTLFHSRIKHHRSEDPYGGLSRAANWESYGAELSLHTPITAGLSATAAFSWFDDNHSEDRYEIVAYSLVRPDGTRDDVYESWTQPAATSPEWTAHLSLDWNIARGHNLILSAITAGDIRASYTKDAIRTSYSSPLLLNLAYTLNGLWNDTLTLRITNLLDDDYRQPDVYGPVEGEPINATLTWEWCF
jgi:outer membrane cobalamin receptor